ncbi:hybrid sensor histidine kinase/response regulator [candidate division KSB3 bacterium]|uniref:histidine kinase n=1 Tax=candidate division KSB3 bacterium TaxID=2044937 RepID=A0A2G6KHI4_9BACT|nr:MAG: hybrid sensor histidine kinase/response regulator [candidate division KSB3 bacterium]
MSHTYTSAVKPPFILMVDDTPKNLQILGNILKTAGYHFTPASSGAQALKIVEKRHPHVILLDIMMPGMDGFEVCTRLKASSETREIPVIFLTAKTDVEDITKGFELGAVDYVTKPFRKKELLARIRTQLALQQSQEKLRELNATKDKFFSIISHDLRGPFNGFLGLTDIMIEHLEEFEADKLRDMLTKQKKSAQALLALLENLLTWSRIQRGVMKIAPTLLSLDDIIRSNLFLFTLTADQKQITITNRVPQETLVYADHNVVNTVIRNLLSNALKFTSAGGTIDISAIPKAEYVTVAVSDTGIGMSPEILSTLFRIDVRHSQIGTAGERGTGLGMILCKELLEKNGGTFEVESEQGCGTTFRFKLPCKLPASHGKSS